MIEDENHFSSSIVNFYSCHYLFLSFKVKEAFMKSYTVTQKLISLGANYQVRANGSDEIIMNTRSKILTLNPLLELRKGSGTEDEPQYILKGNFLKTKFSVQNRDSTSIAEIQFPFINVTGILSLSL